MVDFLIIMLEKQVRRRNLEEFMKDFGEFLNTNHAIKVFILMNKFSLMNSLMKSSHSVFHIDFLLMAIQTDAMDIAYFFF